MRGGGAEAYCAPVAPGSGPGAPIGRGEDSDGSVER
ncbi:hypothetical protein Bfae_07210 [Brachybacterium faecium DSM 4810]|uniref:Uncharacterized protein n=1 Tax=Brachybacterium faecium (strain ATCC 43885 / DSM 4810 / JCM 11609 / LMG 19847 / NBRC 14762 / NCIMB 9860 / 6-10) TaxID=446465 RepID=C7M9N4_BRAFD|nr:hypothetical protein Bfae_07210 [Brachybacterium faecium DSM 4810]